MTLREIVDSVLACIGKTQCELAAAIGWTPQQFSQKMSRETVRVPELLKMLEVNGLTIKIVTEAGDEIPMLFKGHGRRLKGVANKVKYDTEMACALANTFGSDGDTWEELYRDQCGRFFLAIYDRNDPSKDHIKAVSANVAVAFVEKYGAGPIQS